MQKSLELSVHQLVDFLLRTGDIDNRVYNKDTMQEGSKVHAIYQSKQGDNYLSEYYLTDCFEINDYKVTLEGRADGIIVLKNSAIIDEIKSTIDDLEHFHNEQEAWHLGQANCYALMYARKFNLQRIKVRLTYLSQISNDKKVFDYSYSIDELTSYVNNLIQRYLNFYDFIYHRTEKRNESSHNVHFPYPVFRNNQKKLARFSYSVAKNGGTLFVEAPTGTGKTISVLYPYVKSFALGENEKIFYLTAKNSGKQAAFKAVEDMKQKGLFATEIMITSKEKICFNAGASCNPDECPYAKDYYSKVGNVLCSSLTKFNVFNYENIINIAKDNDICPFEFELDLSLYCDIIICDYNYMFDPLVHMQRYFDEDCSKFIVLIDEAHNLVERGRSMYSASIDSFYIYAVKQNFKKTPLRKIKSAIKKANDLMKNYSSLEEENTILPYLNEETYKIISSLYIAMQDVNKNHHEYVDENFKELFFEINRFLKIYDLYDENFLIYVSKHNKSGVNLNIYCLNSSSLLQKTLNKVKSRILFSATLSPIDYYCKMLGGNEEDPMLILDSPFDRDHLKLIVAPNISVRYRKRDESYQQVANYIKTFTSKKVGNYLVFLPSYIYLDNLIKHLKIDDAEVLIQSKEMDDLGKIDFLNKFVFNPTHTTIGLVIVGGVFSEGIDLTDDRLIGVVVVGVGLPQICFERDAIRNYFNDKELSGYSYSYVNPGINRVMQAVGRLIRSENDRGAALLIDDRFLNKTYQNLFQKSWQNYSVALNNDDLSKILDEFWKK
jgi:Rad3-related DNA helicase